jgi:hypothetical protein
MSKTSYTTGGIINNDHGVYKNKTTSVVPNIPRLSLASVSNVSGGNAADVEITLNPKHLTWSDFNILFFNMQSGNFNINNASLDLSPISLLSQNYTTTNSNNVPFYLAEQVMKVWAKKHNLPISAISSKNKISLTRECFLAKSLASINGEIVALSLDEAMSSLLSSGEIKIGDLDSYATVAFTIDFLYYSDALDVTVLTTFVYSTSIPGYRNSSKTSLESSLSYSNDMKQVDRTGIELNDNLSEFSDFETKIYNNNFKENNDLEEYSIVSNNSSSNKSNLISEISKIINGAESVVSSEW